MASAASNTGISLLKWWCSVTINRDLVSLNRFDSFNHEHFLRRGMTMSIGNLLVVTGMLGILVWTPVAKAQSGNETTELQAKRFISSDRVELISGGKVGTYRKGDQVGSWTLMEIVDGPDSRSRLAVLEDFSRRDGHVRFVDTDGVELDLPKTLEPAFPDTANLYCGHKLDEILDSPRDLLADEMLAGPNDPDSARISQCFPPIQKMKTITFVGTHENIDKVGFEFSGWSPNFDPAVYDSGIRKVREDGKVWNGLVGGWLPVVRYVYPSNENDWTEMLAFAPLRITNDNPRIQPVWYRVAKIENGSLRWVRYFDTYHPFPPHSEFDASLFYEDLLHLQKGWTRAIQPAMRINLPDQRLQNMALHSLVRAMMTRVGDFPKYGAFDKNYAGSEHDGFPDTFNVDTSAMLEWGLIDLAGRYIDNYFGQFVRDDGSILYRGPETGQFGRMLTVVAEYANYGGDPQILLRRRSRIDGVAKLLLLLRAKAQLLPKSDPAFGMIAGWSEADACLDPDPSRYMQPYFSNSAEAVRGFRDIGRVWERIGAETKNPRLSAWGDHLVHESEALRLDLRLALQRSILKENGETIIPSIAGVREPFDRAVSRDPLDPQYRSYRAYMEMLYSGILDKDEVGAIVRYRASHYDTILGIPTAYGYRTSELAGFLSYGHAYGLIEHDMVRQAILMLYSVMANQYTRGTWTAPETRNILPDRVAAPYCTPAQLVVPLITRWLLVFEDPQSETLWLGKGLPRDWLADGKTTSVAGVPTRWGKVGFNINSQLRNKRIVMKVSLPQRASGAKTVVRLRAPLGYTMKAVTLNAKEWTEFDPKEETITLPHTASGTIELDVTY